jgi:hypothetical protein
MKKVNQNIFVLFSCKVVTNVSKTTTGIARTFCDRFSGLSGLGIGDEKTKLRHLPTNSLLADKAQPVSWRLYLFFHFDDIINPG